MLSCKNKYYNVRNITILVLLEKLLARPVLQISKNSQAISIFQLMRKEAQPWKADALSYLKAGKEGAIAPAIVLDVITGERIPIKLCTMNDGEYFWRSDLIYYVEKYNLELPSDFLSKLSNERHKCED